MSVDCCIAVLSYVKFWLSSSLVSVIAHHIYFPNWLYSSIEWRWILRCGYHSWTIESTDETATTSLFYLSHTFARRHAQRTLSKFCRINELFVLLWLNVLLLLFFSIMKHIACRRRKAIQFIDTYSHILMSYINTFQ